MRSERDLTGTVSQGQDALRQFARVAEADTENQAAAFLTKMQSVQSQCGQMWANVERGSAEEQQLLSAREKMMRATLQSTLSGATEATREEMKTHMASMHSRMQTVLYARIYFARYP